jgi:glycosyltransferase involved in cell wall biosynthesis
MGDYSIKYKSDKYRKREKVEGLSIITTAYQAQDFVEEYLDSVMKQSKWDSNYEVIIGIDGCEETLNKLLLIKDNYEKLNLRIYYFKQNMGTYPTSNALLLLAKHNNILRFDADDVMNEDMVETIMKNIYNPKKIKYTMIQFQFLNWYPELNETRSVKMMSQGCIYYDKQIVLEHGGYMNWKCSADSELVERLKDVVKLKKIKLPLFLRRKHIESLTMNDSTGMGTPVREMYRAMLFDNYNNQITKIEMVYNPLYEQIK